MTEPAREIPGDLMERARELALHAAYDAEGSLVERIEAALLAMARSAQCAERLRCMKAIFAEVDKTRALSPYPAGSGEPVAAHINSLAEGITRAACAIGVRR